MAYKFSKGKRGIGDIEFEDDVDTGIDFEADTVKLETNGQERVVVTNTNTLFNTPIRTTSIEYTDGDSAITIDDGGHIKLHSGIKYARGVLVSSASSPAEVGGWIKFATLNVPGTSNLDTAASSFLITLAGMESSNNRRLDGIFLVHAKFTVNTGGNADGANNYYESEGTFVVIEPLNADWLAAAGTNAFDPTTDLLLITTNDDSTPVVDLYIKANAKNKHCFVTHLGGTGQTGTFDTDAGWTINTGESWLTSEPTAPAGSAKIGGDYASKIFSYVTVSGFDFDATEPTISFKESGSDRAEIGINDSDNLVITNQTSNKFVVFKTNDAGNIREGLRIGGTVPEVVVNEGSDSLVDFRVESDNQTHMLFVDGGNDKVGIGTDQPDYTLDVAGDIGVNQYIYHNGDGNTWINFTDNRIRLNAGGNNFIDCEDPGSAPHKVRINNGGNNIDFIIKDNSGNVYFTADASTARVGIGTEAPLVTLDVNGEVRNNGGVYRKLRDVNSTGNILQTDYVIRCIQNSAITLTLPSKSNNQGQIIILKDALGNANSNNITVQAATGDTIDGSSNYIISNNKEGVTLMCDGINGWMILSRVRS